jgi:aryl-alcohol dehydrogenase-like predicted oxidoreductase
MIPYFQIGLNGEILYVSLSHALAGRDHASIADIGEYGRLGPVGTDQEKYSLLDRASEETRLPYLLRNAVPFLAYSPLSLGLLTGKIGADRQFPASDMRGRTRRTSRNSFWPGPWRGPAQRTCSPAPVTPRRPARTPPRAGCN